MYTHPEDDYDHKDAIQWWTIIKAGKHLPPLWHSCLSIFDGYYLIYATYGHLQQNRDRDWEGSGAERKEHQIAEGIVCR